MATTDEPWLHNFSLTAGSGTVAVNAVDVHGLVSKNSTRRAVAQTEA